MTGEEQSDKTARRLEGCLVNAARAINQTSSAKWSVAELLVHTDDDNDALLDVTLRISAIPANDLSDSLAELANHLENLSKRLQWEGQKLIASDARKKLAPSTRARSPQGGEKAG